MDLDLVLVDLVVLLLKIIAIKNTIFETVNRKQMITIRYNLSFQLRIVIITIGKKFITMKSRLMHLSTYISIPP
jgi:hypothetical protein